MAVTVISVISLLRLITDADHSPLQTSRYLIDTYLLVTAWPGPHLSRAVPRNSAITSPPLFLYYRNIIDARFVGGHHATCVTIALRPSVPVLRRGSWHGVHRCVWILVRCFALQLPFIFFIMIPRLHPFPCLIFLFPLIGAPSK